MRSAHQTLAFHALHQRLQAVVDTAGYLPEEAYELYGPDVEAGLVDEGPYCYACSDARGQEVDVEREDLTPETTTCPTCIACGTALAFSPSEDWIDETLRTFAKHGTPKNLAPEILMAVLSAFPVLKRIQDPDRTDPFLSMVHAYLDKAAQQAQTTESDSCDAL